MLLISRKKKRANTRTLCLVLIALLGVQFYLPWRNALAAPPDGPGYSWKLVFEDNFDGSTLDTTKWRYNYPWGNGHTHNHDAYCIAEQVSVQDGKLVITADYSPNYNGTGYDYISGVVTTSGRFYTTYGYIEGRLKLAPGQGTWPAFWTLQSGWPPEIDIMENLNGSNTFYTNYHWGVWPEHYSSMGTHYGTNLTSQFHNYAVEWTASYLKFYYDDQLLRTFSDSSAIAQSANQYLLVNLAVGGWAGEANPADYPTTYQCDWVRVWQRNQDTVKECIGYWKLDETSGTIAADSSGHNMNGTLKNGLSFSTDSVVGINGNALDFDGLDDFIELPNGFGELDNGFSVTFWAKPTASKNWARFIDLGNGAGNNNIYMSRWGTSNDLVFCVYDNTGWHYITAPDVIENNQWHFYGASVSPSGDAVIYKDGLQVKYGNLPWPWGVLRTKNYIGRSNWSADDYYQGAMDDIKIFDYALDHVAETAIYYYDNFDGLAGADLNGTTPDITITGGVKWLAGNDFDADGTVTYDNSSMGDSAYLPFVPQAGYVYRLSATIDSRVSPFRETSGANDWIGIGFTQGNQNPELRFYDDSGINNNPIYWAMTRTNICDQNDQTFIGPKTASGANTTTKSADYIEVILNTADPNGTWTVIWYYNDVLQRTVNVAEEHKALFQYVAMSNARADGFIDEFMLIQISCQASDLNTDGKVDLLDLDILSNQWLQPPAIPSADIAPVGGDGIVNFLDFAVLAEHWLEGTAP